MTNLDSVLKNRDVTLPTKVHTVKAMVFPVVMYGCESWDHKEGWALKNWCFWTVVLEKILESPLDSKDIKPVNPKGNQSWIFIGRTDAEAPVLWPPDAKGWLTGKSLMLEKIEGRRRRANRGWNGWMASPTQWTWVWASSGRWWRIGKPDVLQSMGSHGVGHNWATEKQQYTYLRVKSISLIVRFLY